MVVPLSCSFRIGLVGMESQQVLKEDVLSFDVLKLGMMRRQFFEHTSGECGNETQGVSVSGGCGIVFI